jgi:predicted thioesterase
MIARGIVHTKSIRVTQELTAKAVGSGALDVYATPAMAALMEATCAESVGAYLHEGETTVGTLLNIRHLSATPMGLSVRCESRLDEADGKRLVFFVEAFDDAGLIGEGVHERIIVDAARFMKKAEGKKAVDLFAEINSENELC